MAGRYGKHSGRYDTPTDGISKKVFDRANDKHIRRYVRCQEDIAELTKLIRSMHRLWREAGMEEEE